MSEIHAIQPIQTTISSQRMPRPRLGRWSAMRELLDLIVLIGAIYALVNLSTVRFVVRGSSMEPTFRDDQLLLISRMNYLLADPQRGDIVVFHYPNAPTEDYIKRVIGLPGETVEIRDREVYVNGVQLNEPYINEPCNQYSCQDKIFELGSDEYFVMGDNRNRSSDSRSFNGVKRQFIVGEVVIRYWPPSDWGVVDSINFPKP
ncbi:MAG: signal peptidase I [Phototrophicales bacterium]|nr:signal peptidase I [Phototrophicales bacterium]